jgi:hypothetical protein
MERQARSDDIDDFCALLVRSNLATEEQMAVLARRFRDEFLSATSLPKIITSFCTFLVGTGILTTWQCEKLRNGKWKGFFDLKNFTILDDLGGDADLWYFLARDDVDGGIVRLAVTPRNKCKGNEVEFRVVQRFVSPSNDIN